ncbi:hypothetical protein ACFXNW_27045 [Nocardia sp. NPDC059180]|uniref:hypothetical protein n=1 Tax=Nocardia sp. NPDC059180 TaxID=3346761 RepID=UPI003687D13E
MEAGLHHPGRSTAAGDQPPGRGRTEDKPPSTPARLERNNPAPSAESLAPQRNDGAERPEQATSAAPQAAGDSAAPIAGHSAPDPSLPRDEYFRPKGNPVPTDDLVHPDMDSTELQRLQAIQEALDKSTKEYKDRTGQWPPTPPGVDRSHPAVQSLLPDGFDPYHGLGHDAWMASITRPDNTLDWADGDVYPDWPPLNNHRDKSQPFKGAYNPDRNEKFVANMERQIVKSRMIVLDTRNANEAAITDLKNIVESKGWSDNVIWYP